MGKLMVGIVLGVLLILCIMVITQIRASVRESSTLAAIESIVASLQQHEKELDFIKPNPNSNWKILSDAEYDHLISFLTKRNVKFDQGNWQPGKPLTDFWGTRYQISFRKSESHHEFKGRSAGPDRIFNSKDDIVRMRE